MAKLSECLEAPAIFPVADDRFQCTSGPLVKMAYLQTRAVSHAQRVRSLYKEAVRNLESTYGYHRYFSIFLYCLIFNLQKLRDISYVSFAPNALSAFMNFVSRGGVCLGHERAYSG